MRRPLAATTVAFAVVAVVLAASVVAFAGSAVGLGDDVVGPTGDGVDGAPTGGPGSASDVDAATLDENLSVDIQPPRTVSQNVTHVYRVDVDGAGENATVVWTFEGADGTKTGREVEHAFMEDGNKTVSVEVTAADGTTATDQVTVEVVDLAADDSESTPGRFLGAVAIILLAFGALPVFLYVFVLPWAMQHLTDGL